LRISRSRAATNMITYPQQCVLAEQIAAAETVLSVICFFNSLIDTQLTRLNHCMYIYIYIHEYVEICAKETCTKN